MSMNKVKLFDQFEIDVEWTAKMIFDSLKDKVKLHIRANNSWVSISEIQKTLEVDYYYYLIFWNRNPDGKLRAIKKAYHQPINENWMVYPERETETLWSNDGSES